MDVEGEELQGSVVVDVVEMEQGEDARKRAAPLELLLDVDALEMRAEELGGEAARPLVEVAEHDLGPGQLGAMENPLVARAEPPALVPPLHERGAEVDVEDVDGVLLPQE